MESSEARVIPVDMIDTLAGSTEMLLRLLKFPAETDSVTWKEEDVRIAVKALESHQRLLRVMANCMTVSEYTDQLTGGILDGIKAIK